MLHVGRHFYTNLLLASKVGQRTRCNPRRGASSGRSLWTPRVFQVRNWLEPASAMLVERSCWSGWMCWKPWLSFLAVLIRRKKTISWRMPRIPTKDVHDPFTRKTTNPGYWPTQTPSRSRCEGERIVKQENPSIMSFRCVLPYFLIEGIFHLKSCVDNPNQIESYEQLLHRTSYHGLFHST